MVDKKTLSKSKKNNYPHMQKNPKKPKPTSYIWIQMSKSVFSPTHKNMRVCSEDSTTLLPLMAKAKAGSHATPRERRAGVAPKRRQSQADGLSRSMRCVKIQGQWRLQLATTSPNRHRKEADCSGRGFKKQRGKGICIRGSAVAAQTPGWLQQRTPGGAFFLSQGAAASPGEDKAQGMCLFSRWGKGLGASGPCRVHILTTAQHSPPESTGQPVQGTVSGEQHSGGIV